VPFSCSRAWTPPTRADAIAEMVTQCARDRCPLRKAWAVACRFLIRLTAVVRANLATWIAKIFSASIRPANWREKGRPARTAGGQELPGSGHRVRRGDGANGWCAKNAHQQARTQSRVSWERIECGHHGTLITAAACPDSFLPFTACPADGCPADGGTTEHGPRIKLRADSSGCHAAASETSGQAFGIGNDQNARRTPVPARR